MPQSPVAPQNLDANAGPGELPSWLSNLLSTYLGSQGAGALTTGTALQTEGLEKQANLNPEMMALQAGQLQTSAAQQLAGLGLSGQSIGLQQAGIGAESGLSAYQQGIEAQQYGLSEQQLQAQKQGLIGQAQAAGVAGGRGGAGSQYGTTSGEKLSFQNLADQIKQSQLGQKSELAGYAYSQADLARQSQQLALAAQQNGLSEQEVNTRLTQGIQQLGLSGQVTAADIMQALGQTESQGGSQLLQLLGPLAQITGLGFSPSTGG